MCYENPGTGFYLVTSLFMLQYGAQSIEALNQKLRRLTWMQIQHGMVLVD